MSGLEPLQERCLRSQRFCLWLSSLSPRLKERVATLEEELRNLNEQLAEHQDKLNKDHHSFLLQQDVNRLLLESTSNLLKHNVDGNNTKQMMDCARRIDDLVFARGSSIKEEL